MSSRSLTFVVVVVVDLVDIDLVDEQASLVDEQACAEHSLLRATRERSSHSPRLSANNIPPLASAPSTCLSGSARPRGCGLLLFSTFKVCFKLPHATYLTTHAVAFWLFRWGLFVRWKEHTPLSLSHPFWIWSRVSLNMEPLRENQSDKPRLLVAQPRAPAGRRAHATNTRLHTSRFCGSPHH